MYSLLVKRKLYNLMQVFSICTWQMLMNSATRNPKVASSPRTALSAPKLSDWTHIAWTRTTPGITCPPASRLVSLQRTASSESYAGPILHIAAELQLSSLEKLGYGTIPIPTFLDQKATVLQLYSICKDCLHCLVRRANIYI